MSERAPEPLAAPVRRASATPIDTADSLFDELWSRSLAAAERNDRSGYFSALYALMTGRVAQGIRLRRFSNPERLERLTCQFASRYLRAFDAFERGEAHPRCWEIAFEAAGSGRPIVMQHLLLGMNAHINFDLGIAVADLSPGGDLRSVRADFDEINLILAELLHDVQERLGKVSPWMGFLDWAGGRKDEAIVNFSMRRARDAAWAVAEHFDTLAPDARPAAERELDVRIAHLADHIARPSLLLRLAFIPIRLRERASVAEVTLALMRPAEAEVALAV